MSEIKYDRQSRIPDWDQKKISNAKVAVVGAGALGNHVCLGLIGLGIGSIKIYDYDEIETHNLNRQSLFREDDIGKNKAESLSHTIDGQLKEHGDKLDDEDKTAIEEAVAAVRTALEDEDVDAISSSTETLEQAAMKLGEVIYSDQAGAGDAAAADGEAAEADVGIAGGKDFGYLFRNGEVIGKRPAAALADALIAEIDRMG